ncbi:GerMN domain-containing protein [Cohnella lubricantis]|uniref:GerMN domain-containing protein n=1 Tax=Cohnella lubricantis TaxID=2163172 RepID=A0A841TF23_9BACL|nr:GerMN domain-containing protein [Cohnella lubricantis]MBB6677567.1 GerMN domain-containing protein [Cohnella lubricantis]MBP2116547.1 germination protein M [Cohnella lubricantis]
MKPTAGRKFVRKLFPALLLLPLAAGCAQSGPTANTAAEPIDPPPAEYEQAMLQETESMLHSTSAQNPDGAASASTQNLDDAASTELQSDQAVQAQTQPDADTQQDSSDKDELTVYLQDRNGYIAPMTLRVGSEDSADRTPEETAVTWMTSNSESADQLPPGFSPLLPETTKVTSIQSEDGTVTIDFASPFPSVPANQERKMIEALVWTMTELPGVENVKITVDGQALRELPASGLPLPETLSRNMGINLEQASGLTVSQSMAVTLYFSARSEQGEGYFVPVTRLVNRQPDRNQAALQELIKGPLDEKKLQPVLTEGVTVENITTKEDTVVASLLDPGWEPEMEIPSETMQALVLTLTEASGDPKASITFNGTAEFTDTDNRSYDEPVDRPTYINALSR